MAASLTLLCEVRVWKQWYKTNSMADSLTLLYEVRVWKQWYTKINSMADSLTLLYEVRVWEQWYKTNSLKIPSFATYVLMGKLVLIR